MAGDAVLDRHGSDPVFSAGQSACIHAESRNGSSGMAHACRHQRDLIYAFLPSEMERKIPAADRDRHRRMCIGTDPHHLGTQITAVF